MKTNVLLLQFFFVLNFISAQEACLSNSGNGVLPGDEPPGCTMCDGIYNGNMEGFSPDSAVYDFPCGTVENSQWFSVYTDELGTIQIDAYATVCDNFFGAEMVVYDKNLNPVSPCFTSPGTGEPAFIAVSGLNPQVEYLLMVDGVEEINVPYFLRIFRSQMNERLTP